VVRELVTGAKGPGFEYNTACARDFHNQTPSVYLAKIGNGYLTLFRAGEARGGKERE